ncbi:hypothetical protein VPH35_007966 [Triticum aestivum]
MEEGSDYYVVKKGDMVAVYETLNDCQAQICSSGYCWSKEKAEYFSSRGLINASYTISAAELREDLLGALVPCTFQEVTATSSNQRAPNLSTLGSDIRYQPGIHNDMKYEPGTKPVDLNYSVAGSGQTQGYSVQEHAFSGQEAKPRSSSYSSPNNLNHTGAFDAQPVSKQYTHDAELDKMFIGRIAQYSLSVESGSNQILQNKHFKHL